MGHILGALGGLLIGLIILVGSATGMYMAFSKSNVATTEENLIILRMQIQQFFAGTNYTGLTNDVAVKAGIFPDAFLRSNVPTNAWGGSITLTPDTTNAKFTITFTKVPSADCVQLARFQPDAWEEVKIGGTKVDSTSVSAIASSCGESTTKEVAFTAR